MNRAVLVRVDHKRNLIYLLLFIFKKLYHLQGVVIVCTLLCVSASDVSVSVPVMCQCQG